MVIWGDHLWHGSYPKETDGPRLMMLGMYNRPHMATQEGFRETVTDAALARNPIRFARLMNVYQPMPMGTSGPDLERLGAAPRGYDTCSTRSPPATASARKRNGTCVRRRRRQRLHGDAAQAGSKYEFPDLYHGCARVGPRAAIGRQEP